MNFNKSVTLGLLFLFSLALNLKANVLSSALELDDIKRQLLSQFLQIPAWAIGALLINQFVELLAQPKSSRQLSTLRIPRLLVQLIKGLVLLLTFSGILSNVYHQSVTMVWATSGALGIILTFALRGIIADTFSGMAMQFEAPFKVGDWINCHTRFGEYIGRVEETNWRATRLWTTGRNTIIIPNSFLATTIVTNYSKPSNLSRFEQLYTFEFSTPTERVMRVLSAALESTIGDQGPAAIPKPKVRITEINQNGAIYQLRYYIDTQRVSPSKARHTINQAVLYHLQHAGLSLSYPKQDVYVADMPWRQRAWSYASDKIELLKRVSLFSFLTTEQLALVASNLQVHTYQRGYTVVKQGEHGDSMFIVAEGLLEVFSEDSDNRLTKLSDLAPGTFFGEKSLLTGDPRSATVVCKTDTVLCELTKPVMAELFAQHDSLDMLISQMMAQRELSNRERLEHTNRDQHEVKLEARSQRLLQRIRAYFGS